MSELPASPKRQHGCLFYGCIAGAVCLVAVLVAFLLLLHMVKKGLNQYTDTQPSKFPEVHMSQPEIEQVMSRFEAFRVAASTGRPPALELTSDELNALFANAPEFSPAKNKLFVSLENNQVHAQVSVPLSDLGLGMLKGRYLNGTGTLNLLFQKGALNISPVEILVKGKPLPRAYMEKFRGENFALGINNDSNASVVLSRLEAIEVRDNKLIFIPKQEK
jgi:hypothetical protein